MKVEWDWRECILASPTYDEYCGENDGGPDTFDQMHPGGGIYHLTSINGANVKTLVNGEAVPSIDGFDDQASLEEFLISYVDEFGNIALAPNQVIMLFELGVDVSKYPNSSAADFQDLVVLFTIETPASTTTEEVPPEYVPYADPDNPGGFMICHVPPGTPENQMTLSVSMSSWESGHSSGGDTHDQDYLGPCQEYVPENAGEEESTCLPNLD